MNWFKSLFAKKHFELTIWFQGATVVHPDGSKTTTPDPRTYKCKKILTLTDTHIKLVDQEDCVVEVKTLEPVGYTLKQIRS